MSKYRKKPVEVEAVRYTGDNLDEVKQFMGAQAKAEQGLLPGPGRGMHEGVYIYTLEGTMTASVGDWIIRGVQGELYPCRPDIFEDTYEPVADGTGDEYECIDADDEVWPEHDYATIHDDEESWQGECRRCGAEGYEDKTV